MNFYLEAFKNIEIDSLECDIIVEKADVTIQQYYTLEKLYNESGNDLCYEEILTESANKIGNAIRKTVESITSFIKKCITTIQTTMTKKKMKELQTKYDEAVKKDPSIKNKKIKYNDYSDIISEYKKVEKEVNTEKVPVKKQNIFEKMMDKISNMSPFTKKAITIGSAIAISAGYWGLCEIWNKRLDKIIAERDADIRADSRYKYGMGNIANANIRLFVKYPNSKTDRNANLERNKEFKNAVELKDKADNIYNKLINPKLYKKMTDAEYQQAKSLYFNLLTEIDNIAAEPFNSMIKSNKI